MLLILNCFHSAINKIKIRLIHQKKLKKAFKYFFQINNVE